jgi:DNA-binding transcriptional regulator YhcF (GntR family)
MEQVQQGVNMNAVNRAYERLRGNRQQPQAA